MSICRGNRRFVSDVQTQDASEERPADSAPKKPPAPLHLRRAKPLLVASGGPKIWIESRPEKVKPHALATQYVRIANQLSAVWEQPSACREYFSELISDRRVGERAPHPWCCATYKSCRLTMLMCTPRARMRPDVRLSIRLGWPESKVTLSFDDSCPRDPRDSAPTTT